MSKVTAIVFHQHGNPAEVVRAESITAPDLGATDARVRILAAPINPADLNVIEGKYPIRPELPGVPGVEGVGLVEEVGSAVSALRVGDRVLLPHGLGTWRESWVLPAEDLLPVPADVPVEQAAMLKINPATAWCMLSEFVTLKPGDWVLQNAANSGVGLSVMQIARQKGWRTVNFVRRPELIEELRSVADDVVLLDEGDTAGQIQEVTGGAPIQLALNAVGGDSALRLARGLAPGGTIVTYGAMSRQPIKIPNGLLIFQDLVWRGFWVTQWYRKATPEQRAAMFIELFELARKGALHTPVEKIYPWENAAQALAHAAQGRRRGKILFGAPEIVAQFSQR